jgi:hypothetical protein
MTSPKPTRQIRRRLARHPKPQPEQNQRLTEEIMAEAAAQAAAVAQAKAITKACLTDAEVQAWRSDLEARLRIITQHPEQTLGHIEEEIAALTKEPQRLLAERAAQAKANATLCACLQCQSQLVSQKFLPRQLDSRFGRLMVWRGYGWCPDCEAWQFPADYVLGLGKSAPASPYVQEMCALLVSKMPAEQAVLVAERFGLKLSRCTLHAEARRQGLKAEAARAASVAQLNTWEEIQQLASGSDGPPAQPFTLVIEIDAWNIRERDDWGQTEALRAKGEKPKRWHWVYMGTVFRLDHRSQTAGERAIISQRGYAATRGGVGDLIAQLHREAIACGLGQAKEVLVIADGAVWIWNAVKDRFGQARQRLDLYHADQHLWAVAHELYGQGTPEARQWVAPLLEQIRKDETAAVIKTLGDLQPALDQALHKKVQTQIEYFENHKDRMQYGQIIEARKACDRGHATAEQRLKANEPLGSGAIESTCRQYQCRFKRTGQFWTTSGDEALMCLETFWRNNRWHQLYPHVKLASPSLN